MPSGMCRACRRAAACPRTIVLVESVDERAHAVVPQLDHTAVQRGQDPWTLGVEAQALDPARGWGRPEDLRS